MKSTVLKASYKLANKIADDLLARRTKENPDSPIFFRRELDKGGIEVYEITQADKTEMVVLRFTLSPAARIDYDERLITI